MKSRNYESQIENGRVVITEVVKKAVSLSIG